MDKGAARGDHSASGLDVSENMSRRADNKTPTVNPTGDVSVNSEGLGNRDGMVYLGERKQTTGAGDITGNMSGISEGMNRSAQGRGGRPDQRSFDIGEDDEISIRPTIARKQAQTKNEIQERASREQSIASNRPRNASRVGGADQDKDSQLHLDGEAEDEGLSRKFTGQGDWEFSAIKNRDDDGPADESEIQLSGLANRKEPNVDPAHDDKNISVAAVGEGVQEDANQGEISGANQSRAGGNASVHNQSRSVVNQSQHRDSKVHDATGRSQSRVVGEGSAANQSHTSAPGTNRSVRGAGDAASRTGQSGNAVNRSVGDQSGVNKSQTANKSVSHHSNRGHVSVAADGSAAVVGDSRVNRSTS
eukprot:CAMPEP_0115030064 /NCGR_PEP_ID=MMETSP0216-20121206/37481_1 /TAXON_ID=223996 /ORGANISM="Protocruzia adherens, Strain Boccale" /LENGTH=361 /DNA_ID=CAMNT_0002406983 /DNA_START=82 /DNA_END=1163 /DNA_ORIENTATION=-